MQANKLDRNFIYSWIGSGHANAIEDKSDQAMSIYRSIQRLFPGSHLAHLYIGMEYLRTNSLPTASISFNQANEIYDRDPIVHNEMGVTLYKQKKYHEAKEVFMNALLFCNEAVYWIQETILGNLGHSFRK